MKMKLFIDPGHGLGNSKPGVYDPGAVSGQYQEASIALTWSHALRAACEKQGIEVVMSRYDRADKAPLGERVPRAKANGCTHFVSIHLNAADSPKANGTEVLYEGSVKAKFAEQLQNVLVRTLCLTNRGTKWASVDLKRSLAVMKFPGPVALIELGFITNDVDRIRLLDESVMWRVCEALALRLAEMAA